MLAIQDHDPSAHPMSSRLNATGMGLGLVRLLLDAGLTDEARRMLSSLQNEVGRRLPHDSVARPFGKPSHRNVSQGRLNNPTKER